MQTENTIGKSQALKATLQGKPSRWSQGKEVVNLRWGEEEAKIAELVKGKDRFLAEGYKPLFKTEADEEAQVKDWLELIHGDEGLEPEKLRISSEKEQAVLINQYVDRAEIEKKPVKEKKTYKSTGKKEGKPPLATTKPEEVPKKKPLPAEKMKQLEEDKKRRVTRLPGDLLIDNREKDP